MKPQHATLAVNPASEWPGIDSPETLSDHHLMEMDNDVSAFLLRLDEEGVAVPEDLDELFQGISDACRDRGLYADPDMQDFAGGLVASR